MTDLPRLTVTQEQATAMMVSSNPVVTLRLPERPTMRHRKPWTHHWETIPIPEGTRVEVGWWGGWELTSELKSGRRGATTRPAWHPVATATVGKVVHAEPDGPYQYQITLTAIEGVKQ